MEKKSYKGLAHSSARGDHVTHGESSESDDNSILADKEDSEGGSIDTIEEEEADMS